MPLRAPEVQLSDPFVRPTARDTALHALSATLEQMPMSGATDLRAHPAVKQWLRDHEWMGGRDAAFARLVAYVRAAVEAGWLAPDDIADLCGWCDRLDPRSRYHRAPIERVLVLHRLLADVQGQERLGRVSADLDQWTQSVEPFAPYWPISELRAEVAEAALTGRLTAPQHEALLGFTNSFSALRPTTAAIDAMPDEEMRVAGLCTSTPRLEFASRTFLIAAPPGTATAAATAATITQRGGRVIPRMRRHVNYVVVCDAPDSYWGFSAYGRKIEAALGLRRAGAPLQIIHESAVRQ